MIALGIGADRAHDRGRRRRRARALPRRAPDRSPASSGCTFRARLVARKLPGLQRSSRRPRWPRSPTARSRRRSSSRSASSRSTRSASRRGSCSASASLFLLVALSYAEGTAAIPETGGAATFVRRAFNDQLGFLTGWALFLDYVIVIALAGALRAALPRHAVGWDALTDSPTDVFVGIGVILVDGRGALRAPAEPLPARDRDRRRHVRRAAAPDRARHAAPLLASRTSSKGTDLGTAPTWARDRLRDPASRCSPTPGSRPSRTSPPRRASPGRTLPRSLFVGIGAAVVVSFLIALVALSAYPGRSGDRRLGDRRGCARRSSGSPSRSTAQLPDGGRRRPAGLRRPDRRGDPRRGDHDLVLGRGHGSRTRSGGTTCSRGRSHG